MFTGTSILFIFSLKVIISLKKYSYKDRLIQFNLSTLKYRRLREVYKIVKQKYDTYYRSRN